MIPINFNLNRVFMIEVVSTFFFFKISSDFEAILKLEEVV